MAEAGGRRAVGGVMADLGDTPFSEVVIQRTGAGWRVQSSCPEELAQFADDLAEAMVLADLLAGEIRPGPRPPRPAGTLDQLEQLRLSVRQLEHALAARVRIEQAIGVLAERWRSTPRDAFERLRGVARSRGRRVHDLGVDVIASITDPAVTLPDELVPPAREPTGRAAPAAANRTGASRARSNRAATSRGATAQPAVDQGAASQAGQPAAGQATASHTAPGRAAATNAATGQAAANHDGSRQVAAVHAATGQAPLGQTTASQAARRA